MISEVQQIGNRTALSWILCPEYAKLLDKPDFCKVLKCRMFRTITKKPRLDEYVWDPQMIINYLDKQPINQKLSLIELSQKTAVLLLLATGKRPSEIRNLRVDNMNIQTNKLIFTLDCHTKTSRVNVQSDREVTVKAFPKRPNVCPLQAVMDYIQKTERGRESPHLLLTSNGTFTPISGVTLARWTRVIMDKAGIDIHFFKPYSTRAATASKLAAKTGSLERVMELGKWRSTSSFFNHYLRKVKYFSRESTVKVAQRRESTHVYANVVPASPVRKRPNFGLHKILQRAKNISRKVPHTDLPLHKQGYVSIPSPTHSTSTCISSTHVFDAESVSSRAPSPAPSLSFSTDGDPIAPVSPPPVAKPPKKEIKYLPQDKCWEVRSREPSMRGPYKTARGRKSLLLKNLLLKTVPFLHEPDDSGSTSPKRAEVSHTVSKPPPDDDNSVNLNVGPEQEAADTLLSLHGGESIQIVVETQNTDLIPPTDDLPVTMEDKDTIIMPPPKPKRLVQLAPGSPVHPRSPTQIVVGQNESLRLQSVDSDSTSWNSYLFRYKYRINGSIILKNRKDFKINIDCTSNYEIMYQGRYLRTYCISSGSIDSCNDLKVLLNRPTMLPDPSFGFSLTIPLAKLQQAILVTLLFDDAHYSAVLIRYPKDFLAKIIEFKCVTCKINSNSYLIVRSSDYKHLTASALKNVSNKQ